MGKKDTKYVTYNNSKAQRTLHIFSITSMWWYSHRYDRAHSRPMCRWQRAEYEQCDSVKSQSHTFGRNYQLSAITLKICSSVVASNGSFRTFSFLLSLLIVEIFFFLLLWFGDCDWCHFAHHYYTWPNVNGKDDDKWYEPEWHRGDCKIFF